MATTETAEEISKKPEVRQALSQTTGPKLGEEKVKAATKDKFWFVTHALLILGCAILYYLVGSKLIPVPQNHAFHAAPDRTFARRPCRRRHRHRRCFC
ncbi:MAG: hypothetical protein DMF23_01750 [Verrucomicrobia bacterium]|nr:MAG: hypothetical protein DMF23_01750 [Verrucomicrobiota bacterium]